VPNHEQRGTIFYRQGDLVAAERCYRQAIAESGHRPRVYYNLGVVLDAAGKWPQAMAAYHQAIVLKPDDLNAYSNLGCLLVKLGKVSAAIALFRRALALAPNWASLYNNLGQAFQAQAKLGSALAAYIKAIELQPDLAIAYYNAGKIWQSENQHAKALPYFQQVRQLNPTSILADAECGYSLMAQGKLDAAMPYFQQAIAREAHFIQAYCHLVEHRLTLPGREHPQDERDRAQLACTRFLRALQKHPHHPDVYTQFYLIHYHWGNVLFRYGDYQNAEIFYHKALQIDPHCRDIDRREIYRRLGQCLSKQNRLHPRAMVENLATLIPPTRSSLLTGAMSQMSRDIAPTRRSLESTNAAQGHLHPKGIYRHTREWIETTHFQGRDYFPVRFPGSKPPHVQPTPTPDGECAGLNCVPCLQRIARDFSPVHLGWGIQRLAGVAHRFNDNFSGHFIASIPHGRAWVVPQQNSWMVCNCVAIITPDNYLLADVSREYPGTLPGCQKQDTRHPRVFELDAFPPVRKIEGTVALLSGLSGAVYFHWMVDILPRWEILRQGGIDVTQIDYYVINSLEQPFQRETLAALGIPESKIIQSDRFPHIQADTLIVPSFAGHLGWAEPWAIQFLRREFLPLISASDYPGSERIYISRANARYRRVLNEAEVIDFLKTLGFKIIQLESLSFAQQITTFARAKIIVAPHGSGLTNILFCRPGTQIVEWVSPHYVRPYYWQIGQQLKLQHYCLTAEVLACCPIRELIYPNPLTEDIWINLKQLEKMMSVAGIIKSIFPGVFPPIQATVNPPISTDLFLQQAETDFRLGNLELAKAACLKALQIDPNSAEACKIMGNLLQEHGQIESARKWYVKALQIDPKLAAAYANLGSLAAQEQQWKLAVTCYQKAIQIDPNFAGAYRNLAKVWTQLKRGKEAAECGYAALCLSPDKFSATACVNLGNTLVQEGLVDRGINCYRRAIELNPKLAGAYYDLASALQRQGQSKEAATYYQKARDLGLENISIRTTKTVVKPDYLQKARGCVDRQEWQEACELCKQVLALEPKNVEAYKLLANSFRELGKLQEAMQSYRKALSLQPENAELCRQFGDLLAQQQEWEAVVSAYRRAVELDPKLPGMETRLAHAFRERAQLDLTAAASFYNLAIQSNASQIQTDRHFLEIHPDRPDIYLTLGDTLVKQKRPDEAILIYQTTMNRFPENPEIYLHLGKAMAAKNDRVGAMAAYRRAIAIDPNHYWSHHHLGDILAEQGKLPEAIASYHRAIETNPSPSFWHYHNLGTVQGYYGEWEEAIVSYDKAIELNPNYSWSHKNLGDILAAQGKIDEATVCYRRAIKLKPRIL
jgi:tetratricopeptide (TPR) repeat protein